MNAPLPAMEEQESGRAIGRLAMLCDLSGALHLPEERTLVVADLHFEKGSARAGRGFLIPPYDTRDTLARLEAVIARLAPRRVIALGDSFHDRHGPSRLGTSEREALCGLQRGRDWVWITGNHDPALPSTLEGEVADAIEIAGVRFVHEPGVGAGPDADGNGAAVREIAGHLHPVAKIVARGGRTRRRCFAMSATRCILPAFGAYAGGLNVRNRAFAPLFPGGFMAHVIGAERVYAIDSTLLRDD